MSAKGQVEHEKRTQAVPDIQCWLKIPLVEYDVICGWPLTELPGLLLLFRVHIKVLFIFLCLVVYDTVRLRLIQNIMRLSF